MRKLVAGSFVLALAALILVGWLARRAAEAGTSHTRAVRQTRPSPARGARASRAAVASPPPATVASAPSLGVAAATLAPRLTDPLATYLRSSRYPPHSRSLTRGSVDLIAWNARHERPRPSRHDARHRYLLTADRYWLVGPEPLTVSLRAWRGEQPIWVDVLRTTVDVEAPHEAGGELMMQRVGDAWVGQLDPTTLGIERGPVRLRLRATFALPGQPAENAVLDAIYNPAASVPARFDGTFADQVQAGSLVIDVGVTVLEPGHYLLDANLYDSDGEPVAWSRFKGELEEGQVSVPLSFHGKVLVDAGGRAPYRLAELRGALYLPGAEPDLAMMPPFEGSYETRAHPLSSFSDEPWDSPHKRAKIAKLRQIAARGDGPRVGTPAATQRP